jgi:hypothetical protein
MAIGWVDPEQYGRSVGGRGELGEAVLGEAQKGRCRTLKSMCCRPSFRLSERLSTSHPLLSHLYAQEESL